MDQGEVLPTVNTEAPSLNSGEESPTEKTQVELDDVIRRETHQRVLKESQKYKQRAMEAEAKASALEEAKMSEQQQYKELADRYKSELDKVKQAQVELQLKTQLVPALSKAGCVDPSDAMQLGNQELLFGAEGSLEGVEDYVNDLKQRKPYLFDAGKPSSVNPSLPSAGDVASVRNTKPVSEMSESEIRQQLRELTRQQRR